MVPAGDVEDVWLNALKDIDGTDTDINYTTFTDYNADYWVEDNRHLWNHYHTV